MHRPPGPAGYGGVQPPWTDRTTATHSANGTDWAVIIDWAERPDGTRVAASVTLSSLGGTLTDDPAPDATPEAATRALIESVPWGTILWEARTAASAFLPGQHHANAYAASDHEQTLRLVASVYVECGGEANRTVAQDVHRVLVARGVGVTPRKNNPEGVLTEQRVREWIGECRDRKRGLIPPSTRPSKARTPLLPDR